VSDGKLSIYKKRKGNSHEFPNPIFVNLKSNTIMKKPRCKITTLMP